MNAVGKLSILAAGVLTLSIVASPALRAEEPVVNLKVSLFTPPAGILNVQMKRIKERIESESAGKIRLNIYESAQMGPAPRQYDLVRTGVADISIVLVTLTPGRFPLSELGTLPDLVKVGDASQASKLLSTAILENSAKYLAKEYEGTRLVNVAVTPAQGFLTKKEVTTLADLKGLRIRHGGKEYVETIEALGAVAVSVSPTDLAEALSRGRIDGVLGLYSTATTFQLQDSAKYFLPASSGGLVFAVVMNSASYDRIPTDLKPIVDKYFGPATQPEWSQLFLDEEAAARQQLEAKGVKVGALVRADQEIAEKTAAAIREKGVAQAEAAGRPARNFIAALQASVSK